jgi:hypothetical protein
MAGLLAAAGAAVAIRDAEQSREIVLNTKYL